jgi:methionyl-tRNA synthetase
VWFDAPIGYISATKELTPEWEKYWKDPKTRLIHFIGKDNIVFHCIVFPAMLKAHGEFILPDNVPANEFLNLEGDKISTSRNWAVWLHEYLQDFPGKEDVLRYVLTANAPETKDNDFTWKDFQTRNNSELVAILGNFVNRAMVLTHKYFNGIVPEVVQIEAYENEIQEQLKVFKKNIEDNIENFRFRDALKEYMNIARLGNKYLADTEPWALIKSQPDRVKTILNYSLQIAANLAILGEPFLPFTSKKLLQMLKLSPEYRWDNAGSINILPVGHQLGQSELLFEKIEDEAINKQLEKLHRQHEKTSESNTSAPQKSAISYDEFSRMDIKVGTITHAEKVPKTKKLLKLTIDTGIDQRTVVSGIAEYFEPEKIIGQQVCILVNLEPREIKGIVSHGMILMAEDKDGRLEFVSPLTPVSPGSTVK